MTIEQVPGDQQLIAEHVGVDHQVDGDGRLHAVILRRQADALAHGAQVEHRPGAEGLVHAEVDRARGVEEPAVGHVEVAMEGRVLRASSPAPRRASALSSLVRSRHSGVQAPGKGDVRVRRDLGQRAFFPDRAGCAPASSPPATKISQGWVLAHDGVRRASVRMASRVSRGTGRGRNARTVRRSRSASPTSMARPPPRWW